MDFTHPITFLRAWFDKAESESIEITYTSGSRLLLRLGRDPEVLDFQSRDLIRLSNVYTHMQVGLPLR
jgi:hypothetical protein